jgi:hypothetical protein
MAWENFVFTFTQYSFTKGTLQCEIFLATKHHDMELYENLRGGGGGG